MNNCNKIFSIFCKKDLTKCGGMAIIDFVSQRDTESPELSDDKMRK